MRVNTPTATYKSNLEISDMAIASITSRLLRYINCDCAHRLIRGFRQIIA